MVVEAITGLKLDEYIDKHILVPLDMQSTVSAAKVGPDVKRLVVHFKMDGKLTAAPQLLNAVNPVVRGGGGYLFSTLNDWMKLMAAILNDGTSPKTGRQILKPETIRNHLFTDEIPPGVDRSELGEIVPSLPAFSRAGSFLPSLPVASRGWSCGGLLINQEDLPFGRKAGSGAWAGLMNLYYWIDPTSKLAGLVCTSVLPFMDPAVLRIFDELERIAYGHETSGDGDNVVRNYALQAAA